MRDVYTRARSSVDDSPACLRTVTPRREGSRRAPGPPPLRPLAVSTRDPAAECEVAADACAGDGDGPAGAVVQDTGHAVRGHEELPDAVEAVEAGPERGSVNSGARAYCTLPRRRGGVAAALFRLAALPPRRTTPDGTDIYYWCDLPARRHAELDDGAYNPLWALRGFTQTFHLWKEGKRQQSAPLNAYLTYVTLPWWTIAKDILDHREEPILTF